MRPVLTVAIAAAATLGGSSVASAATQVASDGGVTATFSFERYGDYRYGDFYMAITRNGEELHSDFVSLPGCGDPGYCSPAGEYAGERAIRVRDLDGDGEPEVMLDLFTGGAHCCFAGVVWGFSDGGYDATVKDWSHGGYRLRDLDGNAVPEFVTGDMRFAYAFDSFAGSAFPVRIWHYTTGRYFDDTTDYRAVVRSDSRRWERRYRRVGSSRKPLGVLAAWAADEYRLGHRRAMRRFLWEEYRRGHLRGWHGLPRQSGFIRVLDRRLQRWGY